MGPGGHYLFASFLANSRWRASIRNAAASPASVVSPRRMFVAAFKWLLSDSDVWVS